MDEPNLDPKEPNFAGIAPNGRGSTSRRKIEEVVKSVNMLSERVLEQGKWMEMMVNKPDKYGDTILGIEEETVKTEEPKPGSTFNFVDNKPTPINIPKFTGAGLTARNWGLIVKNGFAAAKIEKEIGISKIFAVINEPYISLLISIMQKDQRSGAKMTLNDVIDAFVKSVSADNHGQIDLAIFNQRRQRFNEPPFEYSMALRQLILPAFTETLSEEDRQKILLQKFIEGLHADLRAKIKISMPKNFEEAVMAAQILSEDGGGYKPRFDYRKKESREPEEENNDESLQVYQIPRSIGKREFNKTFVKYNGKLPRAPRTFKLEAPLGEKNRVTETVNTIEKEKTICYFCSGVGHIKRECEKFTAHLNDRRAKFRDSGQRNFGNKAMGTTPKKF